MSAFVSDCNLKSLRCTTIFFVRGKECVLLQKSLAICDDSLCRGLSPHFTLLSNLSQLCKTAPLLYSFVLSKTMKLISQKTSLVFV